MKKMKMDEKDTALKKAMKKQMGWKVNGWKIEMSRESNELKRTWMEKVLDRKGNGWFLEEYSKFRLDDRTILNEVTTFPILPLHLFET